MNAVDQWVNHIMIKTQGGQMNMEVPTEQIEANKKEADASAWDEFLAGDFLGADLVSSEAEGFRILEQFIDTQYEAPRIVIKVEKKGLTKPLKFGINKTNGKFLKAKEIEPLALPGKTVYFTKVQTRNPQTNLSTTSLVIAKIE